MSDLDLGIKVFLQLATILAVCRLFGYLGTKFLGQTQVVSEMIAGVFLGPTVLGNFFPYVSKWLFPPPSIVDGHAVKNPTMLVLYAMSQVGLALYMFIIGIEFDLGLMRSRGKAALLVSMAGIVMPFTFGALLALGIHDDSRLFPPSIGTGSAVLYTGAAMCITAFPMLARIIYEKKLFATSLGTLSLAAGAFNDLVAWVLLAVVLAFTKSNPLIGVFAVGGGIVYAIIGLNVGGAIFRRIEATVNDSGDLSSTAFSIVLTMLMLGCFITDSIGVYAVFGAFIMGSAMPKGNLAKALIVRIEPVTVGLLLPLFFVYSGLNTNIALLKDPSLVVIAILALLAAFGGKGVACCLAARIAGESWHDSAAIGVLMNARGLMELIILNIGLSQGVIRPALFTILVLMAVITTVVASPAFEAIYKKSNMRPT